MKTTLYVSYIAGIIIACTNIVTPVIVATKTHCTSCEQLHYLAS